MSSAVLHTSVAVVVGAIVAAGTTAAHAALGMPVSHAVAAGITAGALVGAAIFPAWEIGQSRVKESRSIHWVEMWPPMVACLGLGAIAHVVRVAVVGA